MSSGQLFVVATPIGNIGDMSYRAVEVLKQVDLIAAEDTRHSQYLLQHYLISTPCVSLHDHNETQRSQELVSRILDGQNIALISDAGTPLISDPGYRLVKDARSVGIQVSPIPGACAAIAALSVGGLPTDQFFFEGFLSAKSTARCERLRSLSTLECTLVFYESTHRIIAMLEDVKAILGCRELTLAREITKKFETILNGTVDEVLAQVCENLNQQKGEFVVLVRGAIKMVGPELSTEHRQLLFMLSQELPPKKASAIVAHLSGQPKRDLYNLLVEGAE